MRRLLWPPPTLGRYSVLSVASYAALRHCWTCYDVVALGSNAATMCVVTLVCALSLYTSAGSQPPTWCEARVHSMILLYMQDLIVFPSGMVARAAQGRRFAEAKSVQLSRPFGVAKCAALRGRMFVAHIHESSGSEHEGRSPSRGYIRSAKIDNMLCSCHVHHVDEASLIAKRSPPYRALTGVQTQLLVPHYRKTVLLFHTSALLIGCG